MSFVMLTESQLVPPSSADAGYRRPTGKGAVPDVIDHGRGGGVTGGSAGDDDKRLISHQIERAMRLFEILSARSDIDHPVCVECTEMLIEGLQTRLQHVTKERDAFVEFLKKVNDDVPTEDEKRRAEAELRARQQQEEAAYAELVELEREKAAVDREIAALEDEARRLDVEEEVFWRERNAFTLQLSDFQSERDSVNTRFDHDARQLEQLRRTNVYNDSFCIGHDGYFGTINGLRLGRLPGQAVDWAEINAAWGQTLLLLATVAEKLSFTFDGYRLRPMGSTSRIERVESAAHPSPSASATRRRPGSSDRLDDQQDEEDPRGSEQGNVRAHDSRRSTTTTATASGSHRSRQQQQPSHQPTKITVLELYSSSDVIPIGRMFQHWKLDHAMVAFLECLRQLGDYVERQTTLEAAGGSRPSLHSAASKKHQAATPSPHSPSRSSSSAKSTLPKSTARAPSPPSTTTTIPGSGSHSTAAAPHAKIISLPYTIKKDKIADASIKLAFNDDETWTRACKYTLTCCKFLLAHASNVGGNAGGIVGGSLGGGSSSGVIAGSKSGAV